MITKHVFFSVRFRSSLVQSPQDMDIIRPGSISSYPLYDYLLDSCLELCKQFQSRRVIDQSPEILSQTIRECKIIHAQSFKIGSNSEGRLGNAVLDFYCKSGDLNSARKVFSTLEQRDVFAWNSFISIYSRLEQLDEVVKAFRSMRRSTTTPNQYTYAVLLSACARLLDIRFGRQLHCDVMKMGLELNSFCGSSLVDMYAKHSFLNDARQVFDQMPLPGMVSCTAMIVGYVQMGLYDKALEIVNHMERAGVVPDEVASITIIDAFIKSQRLDDALNFLYRVPEQNVVAWNMIISAHAKSGYELDAVKLFFDMRKARVPSTRPTLGSVLSAIASLEALNIGLAVHSLAIKQGLDDNVYVGSSLTNMYSKCQNMKSARKVFDFLDERNIVLWNAMLGGYSQNGCPDEVVELFMSMKNCGFEADEFTYTSILSACGCLKRLDIGHQLHSVIIKRSFALNLFVCNALVDMFAKSGALKEARKVFENIKNRDNISWNVIIAGYVKIEEENEAFDMFGRMMAERIQPDEAALASISNACANIKDPIQGKQIHCATLKHGLETSLYAGSSLIDMYVKCGDIVAANKIFFLMPSRNVVSINALIAGYAQHNLEEALKLYQIMQTEGLEPSKITFSNLLDACSRYSDLNLGRQIHCLLLKKDIHVYDDEFLGVSLLGMYMNCSKITYAHNLFHEFPDPKTTVLWTAMISGFNQNGHSMEALHLYREMRNCHNLMPDQATFASVLKSCSTMASLADGTVIHSFIVRNGFVSDELLCSALIDMYAKCGDVYSSINVFMEMDHKNDVISWNSIIVGLAKNGYADHAMKIFDEMMTHSHVIPDDVTFLGILTACSHAGRISEGRQIYDIMTKQYRIQPRSDHCACMIDLFGRCGLLDEAETFIDELEFKPDAMIWASFLGACKLHGDEVRGLHAAKKLIELDPENSSTYTLLSNIYASSGNWSEANYLRKEMKDKGAKKLPGCSWIGRADDNTLLVSRKWYTPDVEKHVIGYLEQRGGSCILAYVFSNRSLLPSDVASLVLNLKEFLTIVSGIAHTWWLDALSSSEI